MCIRDSGNNNNNKNNNNNNNKNNNNNNNNIRSEPAETVSRGAVPVISGNAIRVRQPIRCHTHTSCRSAPPPWLSLIHISEPTRLLSTSYAVFCLKKNKSQVMPNRDYAGQRTKRDTG